MGVTSTAGPKARVTQLDIARAAGVHNTTVSLALRNSPSIPAATRQRIQELAIKLGYSPDPALRALVAYRQGLATNRRTETIAYITHGETKWSWRENLVEEQYFLGAQQRAASCGYHLEHFWLGEPGLTDRRLSGVLFHRGITGVLLAAQAARPAAPLDLEWNRLSAVALGHLPHTPALHRVTSDATGNIRLALQQVRNAGYRRIGLILPQAWDDAVDHGWSIGFMAAQHVLPPAQRVPILYHPLLASTPTRSDQRPPDSIDAATLARWLNDFQPDAILGSLPLVAGALSELGIEIGRDLAFVDLLHESAPPAVAGVRQNCQRVGEVAVELLMAQLQQNLRGLPPIPTTTLVSGAWHEGASLLSRRVANWASEASSLTVRNLKPAETAA